MVFLNRFKKATGIFALIFILINACAAEDKSEISEQPQNLQEENSNTDTVDPGSTHETPSANNSSELEPSPESWPTRKGRLTAPEPDARIDLMEQPTTGSPDKGYGLVGDVVELLDSSRDRDTGVIWHYVRFDVSDAEGWILERFIDLSKANEESPEAFLLSLQRNFPLLSEDQKRQLLSIDGNNPLGIAVKIVLPDYVPEGFEVAYIDTEYETGYTVVYADDNNNCFKIGGYSDLGAGGEDFEIIEVESRALGLVRLGFTQTANMSDPAFIAFEYTVPGKIASRQEYNFSSPSQELDYECNAIEVEEAVKIVESLDYLNPYP